MNKKLAVPRGTSDILPDAILLWEALESKARKICKSYGYREIRTPIYEDVNLFKRSLGSTSDVVNKQLLELASGKEDGGYALRPEGTAAVVRSYLEHSFDKKEALSKFFYIGPMFRGERPQKGRLRQFHQIGTEAIGTEGASPFLDAELVALAMHLLDGFGVKEAKLKINSLGSQADRAAISSWLREQLGRHRQELCEECQARFDRNVFRVLDCKNESCRRLVKRVLGDDLVLPLPADSKQYFQKVQAVLKDLNIAFEVSPHLVRGLDYYTHTVFEITAEGLGSQDAIGAGGRYGGLAMELGGGENVGGIGFALGMERILLAVNHVGFPAGQDLAPQLDAFVIAMTEEFQPQACLLVQELRQAQISGDMSFKAGSMKSQMGKADKAGARFALIIGEQEYRTKTVTVKNMQKSSQETMAYNMVKDYIRKAL